MVLNWVLINLLRRRKLVILCIVAVVLLVGCSESNDVDGDGLNESVESKYGLDDTSVDSDGDGLNILENLTTQPSTRRQTIQTMMVYWTGKNWI